LSKIFLTALTLSRVGNSVFSVL